MGNKIDLFLDFDETITLSTKQFVKVANKMFQTNKDWEKTRNWNFIDLYPNITIEDINRIFCSDDFFVDLEMHKDVSNVLKQLNKKVNITIATIGMKENLIKKEQWLRDNLGFADIKFIGLLDNEETAKLKKSKIDMSNGIFIDDRVSNLVNSNAKIKILYKDYRDYSWQKLEGNEEIYVVNSWKEISDIINFCLRHKNSFM